MTVTRVYLYGEAYNKKIEMNKFMGTTSRNNTSWRRIPFFSNWIWYPHENQETIEELSQQNEHLAVPKLQAEEKLQVARCRGRSHASVVARAVGQILILPNLSVSNLISHNMVISLCSHYNRLE